MQLFERKPQIVEAKQWDKNSPFDGELQNIVVRRIDKSYVAQVTGGNVLLEPGDWIVKHDSGRLEVWSDKDFRATFRVPEEKAAAPKKKTASKKKVAKKKTSKK